MKNQEKVTVLIREALRQIQQRLTEINDSQIPTKENLQKIHEEIEYMQKVMSPDMFYPTYAHQIVDSWDLRDDLGNILLELKHQYVKLKG